MRVTGLVLALPLVATSFVVPPFSRVAQANRELLAAAKVNHHRHHQVRRYRRFLNEPEPRGQIACTPVGCGRIPPNCHPTTAYYPNGLPTGYDAVVCR